MTGWRVCPVCGEPDTPPWQATCGRCWHFMPADLRWRLLAAWRFRVIENSQYQEVLAEALIWATERRRPTR